MYEYIIIFSICIFLYSIFSKKINDYPISGPLLFVVTGFIFGPVVLNLFDFKVSGAFYENLADFALALVLFTGASKVDLKVLKSVIAIPTRLLLIGLPLTIVFGIIAGYFVFDGYLVIELAILATVLAPTDAALGEAVVTNKSVPPKVREALNVESGLNDGISVPVFLFLIALFKANSIKDISAEFAIGLFLKEIGFGLLVGVIIMFITLKLLKYSSERKWIEEAWKPTIIVAITFAIFSLAQLVGGSGFIASFSAGFIFGTLTKKYKTNLLIHAEGLGNTLTFIVWIIFGSHVITNYYKDFTWQIVLYSILSLTLVRIVPVFISLIKTGGSIKEKLFIGWFGPRGLASVVFAIMLFDIELPHEKTIVPTIFCTVLFSVVAHGISANPMASSFSSNKNLTSGSKKSS